jgi:hypothetical protein
MEFPVEDYYARLEAVMAVIMNATVFWNVTLRTLKTAAVGFSETLANVYQITLHHISCFLVLFLMKLG